MNVIMVAVVWAGIIAQLLKIIVHMRQKAFSLSAVVTTGGMPSTHSALVVSLVSIIYLQEGFSTSFIISLVLALIVLRDSFGVRRTAGLEGVLLKKLLRTHHMKDIKEKTPFSLGHTPVEVFVGAGIGLIVSLLVYFLR